MGIFDKAKDFVEKNPDKANSAIDRVGDMVDKKTNNQHVDKVDRAQQIAKDRLNRPNTQP